MNTVKAYRLNNHEKLFGFNDAMGAVPVLDQDLLSWQNELFDNVGIHVIDVIDKSEIKDKEYFLFENNLFFTKEFLKKVIDKTENTSDSIQFAVESNSFNDRFSFPTGENTGKIRAFNFFYSIDGKDNFKTNIIPQKCFSGSLNMPRQLVKSGTLNYDYSDTFIAAIISPFHLLFVNLFMNFYRMAKVRRCIPNWVFNWIMPERSRNFYRMLRCQNKIGKNCKIHPTAVIEGAVIGDNVQIGAFSVVRLSTVADNCTIEDHASVQYSVLGCKSHIAHGNIIISVLSYPEVFLIHGPYQFSVFGENVSVFGTINCDTRLDQQNIKIPTENGVLDSNQEILGIAYGHRSKVPGGSIVAPGRIVPNDYFIASPESMITDFPDNKNINKQKSPL